MDSETTGRFNGQKLGLFVFECIMALMYVAFAIALLFTHLISPYIQDKGMRIFLGIAFGLYGLFRIYRAYIKIVQRMND